MTLSPIQKRRLEDLLAAPDTFMEMALAADLDPRTDFRNSDWQGVDFGHDDISGVDFSGANLTAANLSNAIGIQNAIFKDIVGIDHVIWPPGQEPIPAIENLVEDYKEKTFLTNIHSLISRRLFTLTYRPVAYYSHAGSLVGLMGLNKSEISIVANFETDAFPEHWKIPSNFKWSAPKGKPNVEKALLGGCVSLFDALYAALALNAAFTNKIGTPFKFWREISIVPSVYEITPKDHNWNPDIYTEEWLTTDKILNDIILRPIFYKKSPVSLKIARRISELVFENEGIETKIKTTKFYASFNPSKKRYYIDENSSVLIP